MRYRNALENPPLLVVCDLDRIIVHTNFTGTVSATHEIALESLGESRNVGILRAVFHAPETQHPARTSVAVTQDAARHFAEIAAALRQRGLDPATVAHFLDRIVFCLFAEDTGLLPDMVFSRIVKNSVGEASALVGDRAWASPDFFAEVVPLPKAVRTPTTRFGSGRSCNVLCSGFPTRTIPDRLSLRDQVSRLRAVH